MSGFLTNHRLWGDTTFVDQVSDHVYVHLMWDLYLSDTLIDKEAMEKVIAQAGRSVNHYHADNGRFADNRFFDDINRKSQIRTFCGVVWNHQNGIIEKNKKSNNRRMHDTAPWHKNVASSDRKNVLDICNERCIRTAKQLLSIYPRAEARVYFEWCWSVRHTSEVLSHNFLSHLRVRHASPEYWRCKPHKMGTIFTSWYIPWALAFPHRKRVISVEPHHRQSKSPISCGIRELFLYPALHESRHASTKLGGYCQKLFRNGHNKICQFGWHLVEWSIRRGCYRSAFRSLKNCDWSHKTSPDEYPRIYIPKQKHSHLGFQGR